MRMKASGKIVIAVMALLAALYAMPALAGKSGPHISVAQPDHDFGRIPNNVGAEHVFRVQNTGDRPLVITAVRTSCGCTAAMMESSVIEPGGTGNLRVSFNPKGGKGFVTRSITVSSNDPDKKDLILKVSADPQAGDVTGKPAEPVKRAHEKKARLEFEGKCAKCHVPSRAGLTGKKLWMSACARCHGETGQGVVLGGEAVGTPIRSGGGSGVSTDEGLSQTITAGTGHPWMPGFGAEYGGPLSGKQVASLVKLIRNKFKEK